jgi:hypothetical protein
VSKKFRMRLVQPPIDQPLLPYYDEESHLIGVKRSIRLKRREVINVSNVLFFDVAEDGLIISFYLMIGKDIWQIREPFPPKPRPLVRADLAFTEETIVQRFFDATVTPWIIPETNPQRTAVRFFIHPAGPHTAPLELSDRCIAFVDDGRLVGFHLELAS